MESPILNNYVFKRVFGQKDDDPVLISFLNAMLNDEYNIKGAEIINSEFPRVWDGNKTVLLDVQVFTDDGSFIDVEVQRGYTPLISRVFVYGAEMIAKHNVSSTPFDATRCIAIWILDCHMRDFDMFQNDPIIGEFNFRSRKNASLYFTIK